MTGLRKSLLMLDELAAEELQTNDLAAQMKPSNYVQFNVVIELQFNLSLFRGFARLRNYRILVSHKKTSKTLYTKCILKTTTKTKTTTTNSS